ncbi:ATP-binding protein [Streptomyces sp. NPDC055239]
MNQEVTQTSSPTRQFTVLLSATRRGARLARLLTERQLADWRTPSDAAEHVTAELTANATLHGSVPGRGFRLTLALDATRTLRIEVTDTRGDRLPRTPDPAGGHAELESGRGLLLVAAYADRWGVEEGPAPCKTVWAEIALLPDRGVT